MPLTHCTTTKQPFMPTENVRLARYLAACGLGSRRKCEDLITNGRVRVENEVIAHPAFTVDAATALVTVDGRRVEPEASRYIVMNKPVGYTCSLDDTHAKKLISALFPDQQTRLFPVGRLDRESEGLLLCTNDGRLAHRLTHPRYQVIKRYCIKTHSHVPEPTLRLLQKGVWDEGEFLQSVSITAEYQSGHGTTLHFIMSEGRKNEIRRMCRSVDISIERLIRIAFGPLTLSNLKPGETRHLTETEVRRLYRATGA